MTNIENSLKNLFGRSNFTKDDIKQLTTIIQFMDNDKLFGAYELIRPKGQCEISEYDKLLYNLIVEQLLFRGFTIDKNGNIGVN